MKKFSYATSVTKNNYQQKELFQTDFPNTIIGQTPQTHAIGWATVAIDSWNKQAQRETWLHFLERSMQICYFTH